MPSCLSKGAKELQPYFITFSAGARDCIGRNISYLEQTVLLSSIVNRYEFSLESLDWETHEMGEYALWFAWWKRNGMGSILGDRRR
jgi:hypothetical protein